jgi:hypothetical protein
MHHAALQQSVNTPFAQIDTAMQQLPGPPFAQMGMQSK